MKKEIVLLMLVGVMMFALIGCGSDATEGTSVSSVPQEQEKTEEEIRIEEANDLMLPKFEKYRLAADKLIAFLLSSGGQDEYDKYIDEINSQYDQIKANYNKIIDMGGFLDADPEEFAATIDLQIENYESKFIELTEMEGVSEANNESIDLLSANYNDLTDIIKEVDLIAEESGWLEIDKFNTELIALYDYMDELTIKIQDTALSDEIYITENIEKTNELIILWIEYLKGMQESDVSGATNESIDLLSANYNDLTDIIKEVDLIAEESGWLEIDKFNTELIALYDYMDELTIKIHDTALSDEVYITENIEKTNELIILWIEYLKGMQESEVSGATNESIDFLSVNYNDLTDIINEVDLIAEESGWLEIDKFNTELIALHDYMDELTIKIQDTALSDEVYITENIEKTNELIILWIEYLKGMQESITD